MQSLARGSPPIFFRKKMVQFVHSRALFSLHNFAIFEVKSFFLMSLQTSLKKEKEES